MAQTAHRYTVWFGLTGIFREYTVPARPPGPVNSRTPSIRVYHYDSHSVSYLSRIGFAIFLWDARSRRDIGVASWSQNITRAWR